MVVDYDPLDPAFLADPYPTYTRLREHDPVHHHPGTAEVPSHWALSRFGDIWDAVRRPEDFSSAQGLTFYPDEIGRLGLPPNLVMLDPPTQTRLRSLIGRAFTPRRVTLLAERIREFVRERLAELTERAAAGEPVDLHQHFSSTVPTFVLAELFGVAEEDRLRFGPWVQALTAVQNDGFRLGDLDGKQAVVELLGYFTEQIADRRAHPRDDLLGALVAAELTDSDGSTHRLTDWDVLGFCFVVVAGGSDTTAALISHTITLLTLHPDQRRTLLEQPSLLPEALVEALRLESSVQGLCRTTTRDLTVGGTTIPAGEKVLMLYGAANRDPREFGPDADRFDVRRRPTRHLAFSSGPHFCIGNHLARLQAGIALEELLGAHPRIEADPATGIRHRSAFVRGWVSLPAYGLSQPVGGPATSSASAGTRSSPHAHRRTRRAGH